MAEAREELFDVAIVGYGPVGALLAALLGQRGLRTAVFERDREIYKLPRAVHFDHEIMRIFQGLGLADEVLPVTGIPHGYRFENGDGELLFQFRLETTKVTSQGWVRDYMFHQPALEAVLRDAVAKLDSVEVHLEHELLAFDEAPEQVTLSLRDRRSGAERTLRARALVACDGANSTVRRLAGIELEDLAFDEPWLVVDATTELSLDELGFPRHGLQHCNPERPVSVIPVAGPHIRWEFMMLPGERAEEVQRPEFVRERVAKWVDPDQIEIIRTAVYDFHALIARSWTTGRVFLAGDAAHQMPPFMGQGLCSGIRDAANLAWKLDAVLRGRATPQLFESYRAERAEHVRTITQLAIDMGRVVCTQDPAIAAERDRQHFERPESEREIIPPDLPPIDGAGDATCFLLGSPLSGNLSLQAKLLDDGEERRCDDLLGHGFALLTRGAAELSADDEALSQELGVQRIDLSPLDFTGAYAEWMEGAKCSAVLVRPDHHVFGSAPGDPAQAASTLLRALQARLQR